MKYFGFFIWVKERKEEERSIVEARPPMEADTAQGEGAGTANRKQTNEVERSEDAVKYLGRMSGQRVTMLGKEKMMPDA